ncbi:MAG: hypothetical protein U1C51_05740 [Candidatus Izemoplasmatales bacterium]|nr:hypothetical protein [Candidatus Izemoplasmatales bacterium]
METIESFNELLQLQEQIDNLQAELNKKASSMKRAIASGRLSVMNFPLCDGGCIAISPYPPCSGCCILKSAASVK